MPLVRVEITKGKSREYKQALLDGIHAALVEAFKFPIMTECKGYMSWKEKILRPL